MRTGEGAGIAQIQLSILEPLKPPHVYLQTVSISIYPQCNETRASQRLLCSDLSLATAGGYGRMEPSGSAAQETGRELSAARMHALLREALKQKAAPVTETGSGRRLTAKDACVAKLWAVVTPLLVLRDAFPMGKPLLQTPPVREGAAAATTGVHRSNRRHVCRPHTSLRLHRTHNLSP